LAKFLIAPADLTEAPPNLKTRMGFIAKKFLKLTKKLSIYS